jgi:hypothetical protein
MPHFECPLVSRVPEIGTHGLNGGRTPSAALAPCDKEDLPMSDPGSRSNPTYAIGGILFVYGAVAMVLVEYLGLIGLQGARAGDLIWSGFVLAPVIPALVALSGWALMRGSAWGYGGGLLLPLLIVPLTVWSLNGPGRPATLGEAALQPVAAGAVLASLSVPLSLALLFIRVGIWVSGKGKASNH